MLPSMPIKKKKVKKKKKPCYRVKKLATQVMVMGKGLSSHGATHLNLCCFSYEFIVLYVRVVIRVGGLFLCSAIPIHLNGLIQTRYE